LVEIKPWLEKPYVPWVSARFIERSEIHDTFWLRLTDADVFLRQNPRDKLAVADAMGANGCVNVLRPAASPLISLRHPPPCRRPQASV